ncbi:unnamed protein product [Gulo gulo]|uniref:Uncharacterized protein n=1 Tax=Gulo gulo TaxID=48420 RepID=A0A9X9LXQ5_GULGU|nr:unnamed protein product [Gulo gulo]
MNVSATDSSMKNTHFKKSKYCTFISMKEI